MADILPKGHQQAVNLLPVFRRQNLTQSHLGLFRRSGLHIAPAITDAVNVGINTDPRQIETGGEHQVGGFPADAG
jgi:hypothetical protein